MEDTDTLPNKEDIHSKEAGEASNKAVGVNSRANGVDNRAVGADSNRVAGDREANKEVGDKVGNRAVGVVISKEDGAEVNRADGEEIKAVEEDGDLQIRSYLNKFNLMKIFNHFS